MVTGMILQAQPMGEYDRRVLVLTKERGKISAFAKGARKTTSKLSARTTPFCFGTFKLYEGRNSYTLVDADISNYFEQFRMDFEGSMYGMYFMEVADYYTRENNDEKDMLLLLYQSLRALTLEQLPNDLVRYIFEMRTLVVNGEFPGILHPDTLLKDTCYAIDFIVKTDIAHLFTFVVSEDVLMQLGLCVGEYREKYIGRKFKSLDILENCGLKI